MDRPARARPPADPEFGTEPPGARPEKHLLEGMSQVVQHAWSTRGPLSTTLLPLAWLYGAVTAWRRLAYRRGLKLRHTLAVPVIMVGNLIVGGAGKTPTTMAVVESLRRHGFRPGIVSRGYGSTTAERPAGVHEVTDRSTVGRCGDEPLLMHLRTGAPTFVGADRVAAANALLAQHPEVDVIVSDDGLQHLALGRAVQVLVFDERGAGNGRLLPAGPLRERLPMKIPAATLVVYNAAAESTPLPGTLARRQLGGAVPLAAWWRGEPATLPVLAELRNCPLIAAAGLARPARFFGMLEARGLTFTRLVLPDHHDFATLPWPEGSPDVIVTEKDAVKLSVERVGTTRVWVAPLDFRLDAAFEAALLALLPSPGSPHGNSSAESAGLPGVQGPA